MTADNFDQVLRTLQDKRPYKIFTIELNGGQRFEIDHPNALVVRDGVAVFVAPRGIPVWFDHESINAMIAAPADSTL
jgi:hypothetical protein